MTAYALATIDQGGSWEGALRVGNGYLPLRHAGAFGCDLPCQVTDVLERWSDFEADLSRLADECMGLETPGRLRSGAAVVLGPPVRFPRKVIGVGGNYSAHSAEMGAASARPPVPYLFEKPASTSVVGPGATVVKPPDVRMMDWEIELAVVMGRRMKLGSRSEALAAIAGYTVAIDLSARDHLSNTDPFLKFDYLRVKGRDTFCPIGPWLTPARFVQDPQSLRMRLWVNGESKQDGFTGDMMFDIGTLLAEISKVLTLEPGDVVLTGSPAGVGAANQTFLQLGDVVRAAVDGLGELEVRVGAS